MYRDIGSVQQALGRFIDEVYSHQRLPSALGYRSLDKWEADLAETPGAAARPPRLTRAFL